MIDRPEWWPTNQAPVPHYRRSIIGQAAAAGTFKRVRWATKWRFEDRISGILYFIQPSPEEFLTARSRSATWARARLLTCASLPGVETSKPDVFHGPDPQRLANAGRSGSCVPNCSTHCSSRENKAKPIEKLGLEPIERIGGDDGARTRDLRRDRKKAHRMTTCDLLLAQDLERHDEGDSRSCYSRCYSLS